MQDLIIDRLTITECGLAFRYDSKGYEFYVTELLKNWYDNHTIVDDSIVVTPKVEDNWFEAHSIHTLLFINFNNEEFMRRIQKLVDGR